MSYEGKVKGRRKAPYPNSILDRKAFTEALEEAGISVKRMHVDELYKALHKQRYPPLSQFVENYYANGNGNDANCNDGKDDSRRPSQLQPRPHNESNKQESEQPEHFQSAAVTAAPVKSKSNITTTTTTTTKKQRKTKTKMSLPKALLNYIATTPDFVNTTSRVKEQFTSADRTTTKLIVELYDGFVVESVLMRYLQKGAGRASLCVSSQCGCAMGCTFCATGTMGLSGNLTTGEILEQLVHADRLLAREMIGTETVTVTPRIVVEESKDDEDEENIGTSSNTNRNTSTTNSNPNRRNKNKEKKLESVRNVVFMGMGEPLDNYTNVTEACRTMIDRSRWNLAHGRVTVSTVGLISQIRRLTKELPEVSLALSLHAPNQKDREAIVPTASRYPIEGLIDALDNHMMAYLNQKRERENKKRLVAGAAANDAGGMSEEKQQHGLETYTAEERLKESSRRRAMIEYVMLKGASSSFKCAHELGKLCENRHLVVNLIPYNATDVKDKLQCPSDKHMLEFRNIVQSYGAFVTIRRTMGADIASACGQLVQKKNKEQDEKEAAKAEGLVKEEVKAVDIEDVVVGRDYATANKSKKEVAVGTTVAAGSMASSQAERLTSMQQKDNDSLLLSWTEYISDDDLHRWSKILTIASTASATLFLASSAFYLKRKK